MDTLRKWIVSFELNDTSTITLIIFMTDDNHQVSAGLWHNSGPASFVMQVVFPNKDFYGFGLHGLSI